MPKADPIADALAQVPLFQGLSLKELAMVAKLAKPHSYRSGQSVVEQGEPGSRFYLITEGIAEVVIDGRVVRTIGAGEHFGELGLIDENPRSATVRAASDLQCLAIAAFNFRPLLKSEATITYKVLQQVTAILRDAERARRL